jgi:hypothetical protein
MRREIGDTRKVFDLLCFSDKPAVYYAQKSKIHVHNPGEDYFSFEKKFPFTGIDPVGIRLLWL